MNNLHPKLLWHYFAEITQIPRPSKKEEKIRSYLENFAKSKNLKFKTDKIGNVTIFKPASKGHENRPTLVLQSHMDMVCEKNSDVKFNFLTDGIQTYIEGDWVKAKGTTLGADDGIGMAVSLAILADNDIVSGKIECLFTVDEETGLTGAFELGMDMITGKILINLDSEDEGEIFIGCAGGKDTVANFQIKQTSTKPKSKSYKISVTGLKGGHSGDDIHRGYANALKLIADILNNINASINFQLFQIDGGNLRNAIPRECFACVSIPENQESNFLNVFNNICNQLETTWKSVESDIKILIETVLTPSKIFENQLKESIIKTLLDIPHGVIAWDEIIQGLVKTSTNLASIKPNGNFIEITTSQRSSSDTEKNNLAEKINKLFSSQGAEVTHSKGYPGWNPNPNSIILKQSVKVYQNLFNEEPKVKAIHAGLECGLFLEKFPQLDMISIGPTIKGAHSPDERLQISSVQKFWEFIIKIISE